MTKTKRIQAPKFIYGEAKNVFQDAQRKKYEVHLQAPKFIYGDQKCLNFEF
jgi:hypothetical protein